MLNLKLDQEPAEYRVGELISGLLLWDQLEDNVDRLEIRLIWYTEGKGTRDVDLHAVHRIDSPGSSGQERFSFQTPHRPLSFSGKLISLIWAVEAIPFPSKDAISTPIVVSLDGKEILLEGSYSAEIKNPAFSVGGPRRLKFGTKKK